jgi:hypothetical protein
MPPGLRYYTKKKTQLVRFSYWVYEIWMRSLLTLLSFFNTLSISSGLIADNTKTMMIISKEFGSMYSGNSWVFTSLLPKK